MVLRTVLNYLKSVSQATLAEITHYCKLEKSEANAIIEQLISMRKIEKVVLEAKCSGCSCAADCSSIENIYRALPREKAV